MTNLREKIIELGGKFQREKLNNGNAFEYVVFDNPDEFITFSVNNGYVLHGTTRKLEELVPQQANDSSKEFGNAFAVYLTSNPIVAKFCALVSGADVGPRRDSKKTNIDSDGVFTYTDTFFGVGKPENIQKEGYIYIFPNTVVDDTEGLEHIAKKRIKPDLMIQIKERDWDKKNFPIEKI
ncbi:MAG: hypothetical protein RBS01_03930 [Candidatus Dojkabacteria bacterium]|jgi:hypothetical protein|nr:hypothetical protein [Candidatus Dojkabacteria bacterium]